MRMALYIFNIVMIYLSMAGIAFSLVMLIVRFEAVNIWLKTGGFCALALIISAILFVLRKSKCPVPGIDYR